MTPAGQLVSGRAATMEFGLFTEFSCAAGMSETLAFDNAMAEMTQAEALGFDAVWLAEIHFQKDRSVLASPLVIASAIAKPPYMGRGDCGVGWRWRD